MRRRLLIASLLVPALAAPAAAAPPRTCKQIRDETGEHAGWQRPQEHVLPGSSSDIDVESGDIATDFKNVTAVLRLVDLTPLDPSRAVQGSRWSFYFSVEANHHFGFHAYSGGADAGFYLWRYPSGWTWPEGSGRGATDEKWDPYLVAEVKGVIDTTRNEVRWTVPVSTLRTTKLTLRRGSWFWLLVGEGKRSLGDFEGSPMASHYEYPVTGYRAYFAAYPPMAWDIGHPDWKSEYYAGQKSCVVVGR